MNITAAVTIVLLAIIAAVTVIAVVDSFTGRDRMADDPEPCGADTGGVDPGTMRFVCCQPTGHKGDHRSPEGTTWSDGGPPDN